MSALSNGERWQDVVSLVEAMLAKLLVVDNPTAGLAVKAYANLGLKEHWRSVGFSSCWPVRHRRLQWVFAGTK